MEKIQIKNIKKSYKNKVEALTDVSFSVEEGCFVSVIGKSGAGKTTLFAILNGAIAPTAGEVLINDTNISASRGKQKKLIQKKIGTIYQDFRLVDNMSVYQNVLNGALPDRNVFQGVFGIFTKAQKQSAIDAIEKVGLKDKLNTNVDSLSGGEKQRVAIARAIMNKPEIILADEPVASLDPYTAEQILELLRALKEEMKLTVVMNSHNVSLALKKSDIIIGIKDGMVYLNKAANEVTENELFELYGGKYEE